MTTKFRKPEDLAVVIDCAAFASTRRNPAGAFQPSPDQSAALDKIFDLLTNRSADGKRTVLVLAGYAGSGKSTVMRLLIERLEAVGVGVVLAAPTGKAASRLKETTRRETSTVHSAVLGQGKTVGKCPKCKEFSPEMGRSIVTLRRKGDTDWTCPHCSAIVPLDRADTIETQVVFADKKGKEQAGSVVLIVDEASMIDKALHDRVMGRLPANFSVLYVGDKGQLRPVGGAWGPDFDQPTATLEKVHRQAADNPIINLATRIRLGENDKDPFYTAVPDPAQHVLVNRRAVMAQPAKWLAELRERREDCTLLCFTNKTRRELNNAVRRLRGLDKIAEKANLAFVQADRLVVLANNRGAGVMNGEVFIVQKGWRPAGGLGEAGFQYVQLWKDKGPFLVHMRALNIDKRNDWDAGMAPYFDAYKEAVEDMRDPMDETTPPWEEPLEMQELSDEELFDQYGAIRPDVALWAEYGECLTCHKSQGSQWKKVGVVWEYSMQRKWTSTDEDDRQFAREWAYTAVTRAVEDVRIWVI